MPRALHGQGKWAEKHHYWLWNSQRTKESANRGRGGARRSSKDREAGAQGTPSVLPWLRGQAWQEGDAGFEPQICRQSAPQLGHVSASAPRAQDRSFRGKALACTDMRENLGRH